LADAGQAIPEERTVSFEDPADLLRLLTASRLDVFRSVKGAYTRQAGFAPIQNEQMVLSYVRQHGRIKRAEAKGLCRLSEGQVKALLKRMCQSDLLVLEGVGPASFYRIGTSDRMNSDGIG